MCLIIDASIADEIFGKDVPEAGKRVFDRIKSGKLSIMVGGKLLDEPYRTSSRSSIEEAMLAGTAIFIDKKHLDRQTQRLIEKGVCQSNDQHIIALAQIGGARLLYSNDRDLHEDFKNRDLIDNPRGKIYSTLINKDFSDSHKKLLARTDLCR